MKAVRTLVYFAGSAFLLIGIGHFSQTGIHSLWAPPVATGYEGLWSPAPAMYYPVGQGVAGAIRLVADDEVTTEDFSIDEIKPYDGPPILLEEQEHIKPVRVGRPQPQKDMYENGNTRVERSVVKYSDGSFLADGRYREYFLNGQVFTEGQYEDGKRTGEWTYWHKNGELCRKMSYKRGAPDGTWEIYRNDGTLAGTQTYESGQRAGTWLRYDESGKQQLREENYTDGKADGEWKLWYPSGQLRRSVHLNKGKRDGLWIGYDKEGNRVSEIRFSDGLRDGVASKLLDDGSVLKRVYEKGELKTETLEPPSD